MKVIYKYIISLFFVFIVGCNTVPSYRVPQPWSRSLSTDQIIIPKRTMKIEISGNTSPLLGNQKLISNKLNSMLANMIIRRGFLVSDTVYDYLIKLIYKSERHDKMEISSSVSSANYTSSTTSTLTASGLGVSIARAIGAMSTSSSTIANQQVEQSLSYNHTISLEVYSKENILLWQGESTWDAGELNLINQILPVIQILLSDWPSDKEFRPEVREIKETHINNYYNIECKDYWYTCPAVPYKIRFEGYTLYDFIPTGISNRNALACYVDLIQTAEYVLPNGDEIDWKNPLSKSLWEKVTLGGKYLLGPLKTPINAIVELKGRQNGYYINKCKIVDDKEYAEFEVRINKWRDALSNYYDVYKK